MTRPVIKSAAQLLIKGLNKSSTQHRQLSQISQRQNSNWHASSLSSSSKQRDYSSAPAESKIVEDDEGLWVKSPYPDVEPVVGKTVTEVLWDNVLRWGNVPAFECGITGRKYNYTELYRNSRGFAASLIKAGIQRGDVLGMVLPNIPEFPIALFGAWDAGCAVSPVNPSYTTEEIIRQLVSSEAKCAVTIDLFLPAVLKARESCPSLKTIVVIGSSAPQGCLSFFDMIKTDPTGFDFLCGSEIDTLTTTALLPYSSGTTGPPKGVMLTHANICSNLNQCTQPDIAAAHSLDEEGWPEQERLIGLLPFFHAYGSATCMILGVYLGANTMCLPKFEPKTFIDAVKKHRPTLMHLVTPLISFMCQTPDCGKAEFEATHSIVGAAAPIGPVLIHKMLEKAGKYIFFQEGYGMTELSPVSHILNPSTLHSKVGSCGTPIPSTLCKVIDIKTGNTLGANERGELCIRGPQVMKGYYKNEKATMETIDSEGWLHTGDICYYDEDKHFYIVDRLKELIKVKGFQVAPSELEDLLREHDQVGDVAVIGVPDEESGELPRAYIVRKGQGLTVDKVNEYLQDRIATYKQLKGGVEFVDSIPKAPSGKILRRELLAEYKEQHGISS